MAALKKWFNKQKADIKFKKAGEGHRLTDDDYPGYSASQPRQNQHYVPPAQPGRKTEQQAQAAMAAMERANAKSKAAATAGEKTRSQKAIEQQVKKEMESLGNVSINSQAKRQVANEPKELDVAPILAVQGVFFVCPLLGDDVVLPRDELLERMRQFLHEQFAEEPILAAATMLQTLNRWDKRSACIETITKYIENVINNPGETKYWRIRKSNKVFVDKVACCSGAVEMLCAVGFVETREGEDELLSIDLEHANDTQTLQRALDCMTTAEPLPLDLYRDPRIYRLGTGRHVGAMHLPEAFYDRTADEVKKEQAAKSEEVGLMMQLRTKEMRERDEQRRMYRYRFVVLRIRFPDSFLLQGTFRSTETMAHVYDFVRPLLKCPDLPFELVDAGRSVLADPSSDTDGEVTLTLAQLGLAPAAVLSFGWDEDVAAAGVQDYLRDDLKLHATDM